MHFYLTLFQQNPSPSAAIEQVLRQHNVQTKSTKLSSRDNKHVWQWRWPAQGSQQQISQTQLVLHDLITQQYQQIFQMDKVDFVLRVVNDPRDIQLAVFDMDSTLIQAEVMNKIAYHAGMGDEVADITTKAMRGEIDFQQSFRHRLALLKGFDCHALEAIYQSIELMPGAQRLMTNLVNLGVHCVIVSGGFSYFAERFATRLGMQEVYANDLDQQDDKLTGEVILPVVDGQRKLDILKQLQVIRNVQTQQTLAVGDGANDLPMLEAAGMGVAFHAKPIVREQAPHHIQHFCLDALLYLLGYSDAELV